MSRLLLAAVFAASMSLPATDNFARGPAVLGSNWTQNGSGSWAIDISNKVTFSGGGFSMVWWNADAFTADQYSQQVTSGSGSFSGPACRIDSSAVTGYAIYAQDTGIYKFVAGSRSSIGSYSGSFAATDTIKIACTGTSTTTVEVFKNGISLGSATDSSSPITSGAAGMFADTTSGGVGAFQADDIGGTPTFPGAVIGHAPIKCCKGVR